MSVPAWVHNGRTMNTCRLTKSYNRRQNVHTQVPLAGSQGIGRRAPVRMPLRFQRPSTSRFAWGKACSGPQMALQMWSPLSPLLLPEYLPSQLIFQESSQAPPPPGRPPCSALFCELHPSPPLGSCRPKNVFLVHLSSFKVLTYLPICLHLLNRTSKNSTFLMSVFSSVVSGAR